MNRVDWVDIAKGICIVLVVMVHATLGVEEAAGSEGWMHAAVSFARPFRMPDFFLISGLFLSRMIDRPWRIYLDRKSLHFAYFYILWLTIQFAFKAPGMVLEQGGAQSFAAYIAAFVQPFGTLWFIYLLPVMFLATRLLRQVSPWLVLPAAALLEALPVHTGWMVADEFAARYVYFYAGFLAAPHVFALAARVKEHPFRTMLLLALWSVLNGWLVFTLPPQNWPIVDVQGAAGATGGLAELPGISLALGFAGAAAIVAIAALISLLPFMDWLRWLGRNSIAVYLAFFLPMAATRILLIRSGLVPDVGLMSLLVLAAGVVGPVFLRLAIDWTGRGRFLLERPQWARIERTPPLADAVPSRAA